jgi:hypothetical protein
MGEHLTLDLVMLGSGGLPGGRQRKRGQRDGADRRGPKAAAG